MSNFRALVLTLFVAACAAPTQPTTSALPPSDTPLPASPSSAPTRSPTAKPTPTPGPVSPLDGVWISRRITHAMAAATLADNGFDRAIVDAAAADGDYVDWTIREVIVADGRWSQVEIDDGVPRADHWSGGFAMPNQSTVIATSSDRACAVTLGIQLAADNGLMLDVTDDECGDEDIPAQTVTYESTPFHRIVGEGAPSAILTTAGSPPSAPPVATSLSTSSQRLTLHPAGTVTGTTLGYVEYVPPDAAGAVSSPLLLFLPNAGGAGDEAALDQLTKSALLALIRSDAWPDERPFVVLAPQHDGLPPSYCITPAEVDAFLAFARQHYRIDPARIYLSGVQCGAIGGWNYLGAHIDTSVAAAVLITGNGYGAIDEAGCDVGRVPIWALHGADDEVTPARYSSYPLAYLQSCPNVQPTDAQLTLTGTGFDAWTRTYNLGAGNDVYAWLLSHSRTP